jgi:poly(3-hydroxybutyrate) depolymerase
MDPVFPNPAYLWHEAARWMLSASRAAARQMKVVFEDPGNSFAGTAYARIVSAACELFETTTRRYDQQAFSFATARIDDQRVGEGERLVWERPFGRVIAFDLELGRPRPQPEPPFGQVIEFSEARHRRIRRSC